MIQKYSESRSDINLKVIDTTPKWRGIHNFSLWKRALSGGVNLCLYLVRFVKYISSGKVDVVHMTTSGGLGVVRDLLVIFFARLFKIPLVYHIRFGRIPALAESRTLEWRLIAFAMHRASAVIAIDQATHRAININLPRVAVELIPNCINFESIPEFSPGSSQGVFLFAGWVIPAKGIEELLAAWGALNPIDWRLAIVGPVDQIYFESLFKRFPLQNVDFLGEKPHSQTISLIAGCDVFVFPSYSEGFPNAVLEAMACGKPIIASAVGAIPEMLAEGAGRLVAAKDTEGLAAAIQDLMSNEGLRLSLGQAARKKAFDNYSIQVSVDKYLKIWRGVSQQAIS